MLISINIPSISFPKPYIHPNMGDAPIGYPSSDRRRRSSKAAPSSLTNPVIATARNRIVGVEHENVRGDPIPHQQPLVAQGKGRLTEHQTAHSSCAPTQCQPPLLPVSKKTHHPPPPTLLPVLTIPREKRRALRPRRIAQVLALRRAIRLRHVLVAHPLFPVSTTTTNTTMFRRGDTHAAQKQSARHTTLRKQSIPRRWRPWDGCACSW